jgi:hypothetical protein
MMNPAFNVGLLHVPLQINGIPVFLIEMECRSDSLVSIPQLLRVIGGTLQGNMRLVGIQRKQQIHLVLHFKNQRHIIERETLRGASQRQTIASYIFNIHKTKA